jgi:photosystem II stability/assembly factor-like uncharacterized protein
MARRAHARSGEVKGRDAPCMQSSNRSLREERLSHFTRREFLLRAGHVGGALAMVAPGLGLFLRTTAAQAATVSGALDAAARIGRTGPDVSAISSGLRWRELGPFRGGRVAAATGVPGRPHEFYFGAVNGGVWKSIDAGRIWKPVFDSQPVASIGAIAVAPSAPDVVYVGSGESTLRDSAGFGNGMYKSVDAGKSWTHIGLTDTQHIGKIAVDPRDANVLFVAAIGHLYAANAERGVFRSRDGGSTWKKVLSRGDDVGAVEVVIDPRNSRVIYAGLWNTRRPPWFTYAPTNGPGGGIFKSTDGGDSWTQLTHGLPASGIGRTGIAVAPSNPRRVYAVVDCLLPDPAAPPPAPSAAGSPPATPAQLGGFFRSDDAGATWTRLSSDQSLWGRGWYFSKVSVDPTNADIVYVPNVAVNRSLDGGKSWVALRGSPGGDDYHQIWISPSDSRTMIVASDQGAIITHNATDDPRAVTWSSWLNQPTAQMYHISVDHRWPYWVTGAQQDSGAVAVRSRGKFAAITIRDWEPIGAGGESGYTAGDPLNPGVIFGGQGTRFDLAENVPIGGTVPPQSTEPARADWTQPLVLSRADPHSLYYASQFLFVSTDGARSWTQISPDLTRSDPGVPATLDATAAAATDRYGKRGVIYTVGPSPLAAKTIWIGTDDGSIQFTTDGGASWTNVTPPALTAWSRVTMIEGSAWDASTAWASVDRHQLQDFAPYIYRTRDMGRTWQPIVAGLPGDAYVHVVREDPKRKGMLVAGTERGAFVSFNDGDSWQRLQLNLPVTSVRDFQFHGTDLVVGTHGRGIWVLDDISPLRQLDDAVLGSAVHLFKPADVTTYTQGGDNGTPMQKDEPHAENPPDGVMIDYWLGHAAQGPVTLEILDSAGKSLRVFSSEGAAAPARRRRAAPRGGEIPRVSPLWQTTPEPFSAAAGLHRVAWNPEVEVGSGPDPMSDDGRPKRLALTGTFTAKLTVEGKSYTQIFTVRGDPRVKG